MMHTYILKYIFFFVVFTGIYSCVDVVDVDVPTSEPRLVIEASIDWEKGTTGENQTIKLSMLTPYFDANDQAPVLGGQVQVTHTKSGEVFQFIDQNSGDYVCKTFKPFLEEEYTLEVKVDNKTYVAQEILKSVEEIHKVGQSVEKGNSKDDIEVVISYYDPKAIENYQLIKFLKVGELLPQFIPIRDEYVDGNELDVYFEPLDDVDTDAEEQLIAGDMVEYKLLGISKRYYHYMQILQNQLGNEGGLFGSTPVPLKGNCVNSKDTKDLALGYFRLSETHSGTYTVK
ncbi:MAG: DUF4249 family protein [Flavobacteriales bacterium]